MGKLRRFKKAERKGWYGKLWEMGRMALSWELEALQKILEEIWQDASKRAIQAFVLIRQSSHLFRFDERARW